MAIELQPDKPMWRRFAPILMLAAAASCGTRNDKAVTQFTLTSSAFQNGQPIPAQYTCDGPGTSPPLAWSEPPAGTRSFALVVDDPDAPHGTFHHWGAFDIPASLRSLDAGAGNSAASTFAEAVNDSGQSGYKGPCPPPGNGPHHYHFKLYALNVDKLGGPANPKITDVEGEAQKHLVGRAELIGIYERH
jgi:Raf kinase inhibitor-like YbhB/YbcL family protein